MHVGPNVNQTIADNGVAKPPAGTTTTTGGNNGGNPGGTTGEVPGLGNVPGVLPEAPKEEDKDDDKGGGGGGGGGGSSTPKPPVQMQEATPAKTPEELAAERKALSDALKMNGEGVAIDRIQKYDKTPLVENLEQQTQTAIDQANLRVDNSVNNETAALNRALADAQKMYATNQSQISADERNALDNAALYAEARGDRGGIGQAQYNAIQNTAAINRQSVKTAQTQAATEASRQISDLRAQGEFNKADALLSITQTKLQELRQIEEYAVSHNLSVDQINTSIAQWEAEYKQSVEQFNANMELSLTQLTGMYADGTPTYEANLQMQTGIAQMALQMIQTGVGVDKLTPAQLAALRDIYGMDEEAIRYYAKKAGK